MLYMLRSKRFFYRRRRIRLIRLLLAGWYLCMLLLIKSSFILLSRHLLRRRLWHSKYRSCVCVCVRAGGTICSRPLAGYGRLMIRPLRLLSVYTDASVKSLGRGQQPHWRSDQLTDNWQRQTLAFYIERLFGRELLSFLFFLLYSTMHHHASKWNKLRDRRERRARRLINSFPWCCYTSSSCCLFSSRPFLFSYSFLFLLMCVCVRSFLYILSCCMQTAGRQSAKGQSVGRRQPFCQLQTEKQL